MRDILTDRSGLKDGAAFPLKQRQVMIQAVNTFLVAEAPLVNSNHLSAMENLYPFRQSLNGNRFPTELNWHGVAVRIIADCTVKANLGFCASGRIVSIVRERIKPGLLSLEQSANIGAFALHFMVQILLAALCEQKIQFLHAGYFGNRDAEVPAAETNQSFYKPLFIAGSNIAEDRFKSVMRRQCSIAVRGFCIGPESILNRDLRIVEDYPPWDASKILEGLNQGVEKTLAVLPSVCDEERRITAAEPRTEQIDYLPAPCQLYGCFAPVDLERITWIKLLRY